MRRAFRVATAVMVLLGCLVFHAGPQAQRSAHAESEVPALNPFSGDEKAIKEGKSWFLAVCAPCHGPRANGQAERGPSGADLRTFKRGFAQYVDIVKNGREAGRIGKMPSWGKVLSEELIFQIGAFLETLAEEGSYWGDSKDRPRQR